MQEEVMDKFIRAAAHGAWNGIKLWWPLLWPYAIGFSVFVIAGMILQTLMLRSGGRSRLSPDFNRMVGSLFYGIFFVLQLIIAYLIWGPQVIDEIWFAAFGAISVPLTWIFLRVIGFWYY